MTHFHNICVNSESWQLLRPFSTPDHNQHVHGLCSLSYLSKWFISRTLHRQGLTDDRPLQQLAYGYEATRTLLHTGSGILPNCHDKNKLIARIVEPDLKHYIHVCALHSHARIPDVRTASYKLFFDLQKKYYIHYTINTCLGTLQS